MRVTSPPLVAPIITSRPERTWSWSDLHFGDRSALKAFGRPFADVASMNSRLVREWRHRVRAGDTIICLSDIGHPDAWRDRRLVLDIRDCPGERFLVLGNHDVDPVNRARAVEVDRTAVTLAAPRRAAVAADARAAAAGCRPAASTSTGTSTRRSLRAGTGTST